MPTFAAAFLVVRDTLNDEGASTRYSDADLMGYALDGLREVCVYRPDLFAVREVMNCVAGVEQSIPATGQHLIEALGIVGGDEITEADYHTFRAYYPGWRNAPPGPAELWMRVPGPAKNTPTTKFMLSPPAIGASQQLNIIYAKLDFTGITSASQIPLPDQYVPALESYIIFRAETKDDEHVVGQRAALFRQGFETLLSVGLATRS